MNMCEWIGKFWFKNNTVQLSLKVFLYRRDESRLKDQFFDQQTLNQPY